MQKVETMMHRRIILYDSTDEGGNGDYFIVYNVSRLLHRRNTICFENADAMLFPGSFC